MKKKEIINEIIDLYDELERLRRSERESKLMSLPRFGESVDELPNELTAISPLDEHMIKIGKEKTFKDALYYSWKCVKCTYDEETETYKVTSFNNWFNEKVRKDYIPEYMSFEQFKNYFHDDLVALYEKEKTDALNEARNIENVEEE